MPARRQVVEAGQDEGPAQPQALEVGVHRDHVDLAQRGLGVVVDLRPARRGQPSVALVEEEARRGRTTPRPRVRGGCRGSSPPCSGWEAKARLLTSATPPRRRRARRAGWRRGRGRRRRAAAGASGRGRGRARRPQRLGHGVGLRRWAWGPTGGRARRPGGATSSQGGGEQADAHLGVRACGGRGGSRPRPPRCRGPRLSWA